MINMLRALMDKEDNMQEQVSNIYRDRNSKTRNKKKCQGSNAVIEIKNNFDGFISRLDTAEKRSMSLRKFQLKPLQLKTKREKNGPKNPEHPRTVEQLQKL